MRLDQFESEEKRDREERPWRRHAPPVNKPTDPNNPNHTGPINHDEWNRTANQDPKKGVEEEVNGVPEVGDVIRTKKMQMEGKVESIGKNHNGNDEVMFRIEDGRLMKTPLTNVTVVEKLADENIVEEVAGERVDEISTEVLTKYKTAAAKDAREADKAGDTQRGNKRFSGIVKATNKQFDNDKKKHKKVNELDMSGAGGGFKPPSIPKGPPRDYWGNDGDDDDGDHPTDYLYLTRSAADMLDDMHKEVKTRSGVYRNASAQEKQLVLNLYNEKERIYHLVNLFDNSGIGAALKFFLKLSPDAQQYLRDTWEDHGINVDADLKKFGLKEGSMGGINRSAPAQDVSYEHILDEVKAMWESVKLNELSVEKLKAYKDAASSSNVAKHSPLRKVAKHAQGARVADQKIRTKTGDRTRSNPRISEEGIEEDITPWGGYTKDDKKSSALLKAPKSSMQGTNEVPFSQLVQDTINQHGVKWAFDYYVKKHGLPPRQFQVFAGLTPDVPGTKQAPSWEDPSRTSRPKKQSTWSKIRNKLPFEE
jgi:hypothetical protein